MKILRIPNRVRRWGKYALAFPGKIGAWLDRQRARSRRLLVHNIYGTCVFPLEQRLRLIPNPLQSSALAARTSADMAEHVDALRNDGIVILPGFLAGQRLTDCQRDFADLIETIRTTPVPEQKVMPWVYAGIRYVEHEYRAPASDTTYSYHPFRTSWPLLDIALDEHLLGVVSRYFGKKIKLCESGIARYYPMAPRDFSSWQWHHDGLGPRINIMVLLSDVGPGDQYMSYLKKTHRIMHPFDIHNGKTRFTREQIAARFADYENVSCTGPAGTVIVFDSNGMHRGNRSLGAARDSLVSSYCPGSTSWPLIVPQEHLDRLSPLQREVLFRNPLTRAA